MFSELKIAQMSAFLIQLSPDSTLPYMKLIKLLYLSERVAVQRWGESMSGDKFVSMPQGPVLSQTYNLIQSGGRDGWSEYIKGEANYSVTLTGQILVREDFDELSNAELSILSKIFHDFGHMTQWELVDYTHDNCTEWEDPQGSSYPINIDTLIQALDIATEEKQALHLLHTEMKGLEQARSILH
jgi:uncharacterized phage-associated protein